MADVPCRGYTGSVPVYCAHDKIVPIEDVKPNPKNPNQHPENQIEMLAKIITTQGWRAPVTVSTLSGLVVRGHGRLMAARFAGLDFVPVDFQNYESSDAELADLLADNKIAELAEIDNKLLADVFADIDTDAIDIDLTGYTEDEYNSIISALTEDMQERELKDVDAEVAPPKDPITKAGDIWIIGRHRLMCGDSTNSQTLESLMDGKEAHLAFQSPPYNIGKNAILNDRDDDNKYTGYNDDNPEYLLLLKSTTDNAIEHSKYAAINLQMLSGNKRDFVRWLSHFSNRLCDIGIWYKDNVAPAMARRVMNSSFEFVVIFSRHNQSRAVGTKDFRGTMSNVYQSHIQGGNEFSKIHSATFPVGFVSHYIEGLTNTGEIVLDLFGGTGTTLIACEQLDRTCYMMELDPKYCDVIVRRYMQVTGKRDVVLIRNNEKFHVEQLGFLN